VSNKDAVYRISNQPCHECGSSDAVSIYGHIEDDGSEWEDGYCFSCNSYFSKEDLVKADVSPNRELKEKVSKKTPLTKEEVVDFIKEVGYTSNLYRGIKDEYNRFFGHLTRLDKYGKVVARYYPETKDGKVVGYKSRLHAKLFGRDNRGVTGGSNDLSGQVKFKSGSSKYVLVVGGEEDKVAAFQMLRDSQVERGQDGYEPIAVVSPTCGEGAAFKQVAAQYDWFDGFEIIVVGMDSDEAGKKAIEKIVESLPKEKVKIATWSGKDPNKMLQDGKQKQFVRDFYAAKDALSTGIVPSTAPMDSLRELLSRPRITLPAYLSKMQDDFNEGIIPGKIVNIIGHTSCGKSTQILRWFYHLCMNTPYRPGIVSLEAIADEVKLELIGLHLGINFNSWKDEDVLEYLDRPEVIVQYENLLTDEFGQPRWVTIDERDGDIRNLEKQVEHMCKKYSVDIAFIDVLSDIICTETNESQRKHMGWQKAFTKEGYTIFNVLHTRKPDVGKDGKPGMTGEYHAIGSSSVVQSGAYNIILDRDKEAESEIDKNTTYIRASKGRKCKIGNTYKLYYDWKTSALYDFDEFWKDKNVDSVEPNPFGEEEDGVFDHASIDYDSLPVEEYEGVPFS